jgi:Flp pilus assembly protein TadG
MKQNGGNTGFLSRLARSQRGNVIVILAVFLIPITALVGSGLDVSRAYLAKTRLQQACDAGILAGRKSMGSSNTMAAKDTAEITKYVNFNFPQNSLSTSAFSVNPTSDGAGSISLTLSTNVDTSLMKIFGKNSMPVSVTCGSTSTYNNIDIVLVLDTTGSMACAPEKDKPNCGNYAGNNANQATTTINGKTVKYVKEEKNGSNQNISRIQVVRNSLASLKTTLSAIETQFAAQPAATRKRVRYAIVPFSQMVNAGFSQDTNGATLYSRKPTWFRFKSNYGSVCTAWFFWICTNYSTITPASWAASDWDGCVEERGTTNLITSLTNFIIGSTLPSLAKDLNFSLLPTASDSATQWYAAFPDDHSGNQYACPAPIREMQEMTNTEFNDALAATTGFLPNGGTYLDIGMLWAARLLAPDGPWAAENPATYNGSPFSRYVIFMTDGEMDTGNMGYAAYGVEAEDRRVTLDGTAETNNANHSKRLDMTCDYIKSQGVKIFSIAFSAGSSLTSDLTNCASDANSAFAATDQTALTNTFNTIASQIGSLRLNQ